MTVEPSRDFAQLQLQITDQMQWRYELIRPLVLFEKGTPAQRAQETQTHPDTVRTFVRRFTKQGLLGLVTNDLEVVPKQRPLSVSEEVQQEIHRLKALYNCNGLILSVSRLDYIADFGSDYLRMKVTSG